MITKRNGSSAIITQGHDPKNEYKTTKNQNPNPPTQLHIKPTRVDHAFVTLRARFVGLLVGEVVCPPATLAAYVQVGSSVGHWGMTLVGELVKPCVIISGGSGL